MSLEARIEKECDAVVKAQTEMRLSVLRLERMYPNAAHITAEIRTNMIVMLNWVGTLRTSLAARRMAGDAPALAPQQPLHELPLLAGTCEDDVARSPLEALPAGAWTEKHIVGHWDGRRIVEKEITPQERVAMMETLKWAGDHTLEEDAT